MESKLEEKLLQYDKAAAISTVRELTAAIERIIDDELARPDNEIDFDLIDEAIETVKLLSNVDVEQRKKEGDILASKIISEINSQDISPKQKRSRLMKKKFIIPIAAILSLIIVGSIISYALGFDILNFTGRAYSKVEKSTWHVNDNSSVIITDNVKAYKNYDEMISSESFTELLWFGQASNADDISVKDYGEYVSISTTFNIDSEIVRYNITLRSPIPEVDQEPTHIGEYDVYISEYDNIQQAEFNYKGNKYRIQTSSYKILESFVRNLEEK